MAIVTAPAPLMTALLSVLLLFLLLPPGSARLDAPTFPLIGHA